MVSYRVVSLWKGIRIGEAAAVMFKRLLLKQPAEPNTARSKQTDGRASGIITPYTKSVFRITCVRLYGSTERLQVMLPSEYKQFREEIVRFVNRDLVDYMLVKYRHT
jgi:hypothetical protein